MNSLPRFHPLSSMALGVVNHSHGKPDVVLGIRAAIRQVGANIVRLDGSYGDMFRDRYVPASARLPRESVSLIGYSS